MLNNQLQRMPDRIICHAIKDMTMFLLQFEIQFFFFTDVYCSNFYITAVAFFHWKWLTLYFGRERVNWANRHMGRIGSNANLTRHASSDYIWHVKSTETDLYSWAVSSCSPVRNIYHGQTKAMSHVGSASVCLPWVITWHGKDKNEALKVNWLINYLPDRKYIAQYIDNQLFKSFLRQHDKVMLAAKC